VSEAAAASAPSERASFADWMAVIAGMIGSLMALMDVSIVNSSLPVIQAEIGATPSEGTWVVTAYLVAEIVIIPLTAWLERMLGQRALLLGGAGLFTLFSVICGFADTLPELVAGRIGQGLCGGVLIPTALNLVAGRLPPRQQTLGLALTGMAALLGPVIGPVLGGWLTEHYSWQFAFFINVPICAVQAGMLIIGIKGSRHDWGELRNADWFGIAGMTVGLALTVTDSGLSQITLMPALRKALAIGACMWFGVTIDTASMPSERFPSAFAISS
jgi:DHA2 family multidrug resistance protein